MSLVPFLYTTKKNKLWYVLYVKSKRETIIQDQINALDLDIIAYSPTQVVIKQWKDRRKKVNTPLLPKIVLVKSEERLRDKVFQINGTVRYLFEQRKPAIVREIEIEQLRAITDNSRVIDHEITSIVKGTEMDLTPYGFKGLLGRVDKISNSVCWVTLQTLGYTLKLTLK
ncbi:MAG: transcription termination/antitermination NusG family protein [Flavobacteriaceae bacterium]|nr:transcription termination/antitermination NusG family protein [Flavobacteriaceae bacterium]